MVETCRNQLRELVQTLRVRAYARLRPWGKRTPCRGSGFAPDFDIAVVAGDVHSPLTKAIDWLGDRFAGAEVICVPGNHCFWWDRGDDRYTLADQINRGRDLAARRGVRLLIDDAVTLASLRVLGATLFADLPLGTVSAIDGVRSATLWMNDYRRIRRKVSGPHKYVRAADLLALHRASRSWIDAALGEPYAGPRVVVTHHAPHALSLPPGLDLAHCYASDLSRLIQDRQPDLWVHGHVHSRADYRVGATRIVCNARGHVEEATGFDPAFTIDDLNATGS